MVTLVKTSTMNTWLNEVDGNAIRDGVRRSRSGAQVIRPKLRNNCSNSSKSLSSNRSMIGSFRRNSEDANICESCTTMSCGNEREDAMMVFEGCTDKSTEGNDDLLSIASSGPNRSVLHDQNITDDDTNNSKPVWTRTTFAIQNVCCASEVPAVRRILSPFQCRDRKSTRLNSSHVD